MVPAPSAARKNWPSPPAHGHARRVHLQERPAGWWTIEPEGTRCRPRRGHSFPRAMLADDVRLVQSTYPVRADVLRHLCAQRPGRTAGSASSATTVMSAMSLTTQSWCCLRTPRLRTGRSYGDEPRSTRSGRAIGLDYVRPPSSIAFFANSTAFSAVSASDEVVASSSTAGGTATRIFLPFNLRILARHLSVSRRKASIT